MKVILLNKNAIKPFLKYAGGKQKLLPIICKYIPSSFQTYYEPFVGGGSLLFYLQPKTAIINDINEEITNCYKVIENNVKELITDLEKHINSKSYYNKIRNIDRLSTYSSVSPIEKASRTIFLNKTCYNGLFRVNKHNQFNVPYGYYKNPVICDKSRLMQISEYFNNSSITIRNGDFVAAIKDAKKNDFVYFDPPYDPISKTSNFTAYSSKKFTKSDQQRLKEVFDLLSQRGCKCLLSNSCTQFIKELYSNDYNVITIHAPRNINSDTKKRGKVPELLIMNYNPPLF